jgi:HJR/Mrr/RecB family endonuclease
MDYLKFEGILEKIRENYSEGFDIGAFLQKELNIPKIKADLLAEKIKELVDFDTILKDDTKSADEMIPNETKGKNALKFNIYSLDNLSGKEFEEFLKWMFQELGFSVELTKVTADSGVDLVLKKDKEKIAVQAKRYNRNTKVSNEVVLKTYGGMGVYKCHKSIIITTSYFTNQAKSDAQKLEIELWDREYLSSKIDEINNKLANNIHKIEFPDYKGSLHKSLLNLKSMGIFEIEKKEGGKYDVYRHGIKYPVLSFRESFNNITHLSFRIKKNEQIPEYGSDSWSLISSDRGSVYGPTGQSAYEQIVQYLSQFI